MTFHFQHKSLVKALLAPGTMSHVGGDRIRSQHRDAGVGLVQNI